MTSCNDTCQNVNVHSNGYLIVLVVYILLAILLYNRY